MLVSELDVEQVDARFVRLVLESVLCGTFALHFQVRTMRSFH